MPVKNIHHINIRARSTLVAALKEFYETVVGLSAGSRPPFKAAGHWLYLGGQPVVHLVDDEMIGEPTGVRGPVVDHVAFSCTGLKEFENLLNEKEVPYRKAEVPESKVVQLFFVDPAGNGVELQFANSDA